MKEIKLITIDGPASSGKTTIARMLSKKLSFVLLESGAFYRLVTYLLIETSFLEDYIKDQEKILKFLENMFKKIRIKLSSEGTDIYLEDRLIKEELRSKRVDSSVSRVSALKEVREFVTNFMRELVKGRCVVAEGRDMGSVVFPEADLKLFLNASPEERAKRRFKESLSKGIECSYEEILENIRFRDELDSKRKFSPLTIPEGAYVIDTSGLTPEEVLEEILRLLR